MRPLLKLLIFLMLVTPFFSCNPSREDVFRKVYGMLESCPDSALLMLDGIDKKQLDDADFAKYALLYTIAQDKSGIDVDNDSLLRRAYDKYKEKTADSLYHKVLYYMGKYYLLNDSSEKAISCLKQSCEKAQNLSDIKTKCLALEKLSKVVRKSRPQEAILFAREALELYAAYPHKSAINEIYYRLNYSECLSYLDSRTAISHCESTLRCALSTNDSSVISDVYQDLSCFYAESNCPIEALRYAKKSLDYSTCVSNSKQLALAQAYMRNDSIAKAKQILEELIAKSPSTKYTKYYMLSRLCMKEGVVDKAIASVDSAFQALEQLYDKALSENHTYYQSMMAKEKSNEELERKNLVRRSAGIVFIVLLLGLMSLLLYSYRAYRKRVAEELESSRVMADLKLQHERELFERERESEQKLQRERLAHKESQISLMQNYLLRKVDIARKIQVLKKEKEKHLLISDDEWNEIEMFLESMDNMFVTRMRNAFPHLSQGDVRLMMLLRLGFSQKSLSLIYGISEKSVKQKLYIYKVKVGLEKAEMSLREYIKSF